MKATEIQNEIQRRERQAKSEKIKLMRLSKEAAFRLLSKSCRFHDLTIEDSQEEIVEALVELRFGSANLQEQLERAKERDNQEVRRLERLEESFLRSLEDTQEVEESILAWR